MKRKFAIIPLLLLTLLSGCLLSSGGYYIGGYHVKTNSAKNEGFRAEVKEIASQIAAQLDYDYAGGFDEPLGLAITLDPKHLTDGAPSPQVVVDWARLPYFDITVLKRGPEENAGTLRARECIENILKKHPEFQWEFDVEHRTMAR